MARSRESEIHQWHQLSHLMTLYIKTLTKGLEAPLKFSIIGGQHSAIFYADDRLLVRMNKSRSCVHRGYAKITLHQCPFAGHLSRFGAVLEIGPAGKSIKGCGFDPRRCIAFLLAFKEQYFRFDLLFKCYNLQYYYLFDF